MPDPGGLRQMMVILRLEVCGSTAVLALVNGQLLSPRKSENPALVQVATTARPLNTCTVLASDWGHSDGR